MSVKLQAVVEQNNSVRFHLETFDTCPGTTLLEFGGFPSGLVTLSHLLMKLRQFDPAGNNSDSVVVKSPGCLFNLVSFPLPNLAEVSGEVLGQLDLPALIQVHKPFQGLFQIQSRNFNVHNYRL